MANPLKETHPPDTQHADPMHHVTSIPTYIVIFLALMVLTALTIWVAQINFGALNTIVALSIASLKAALVFLYFMHLRHSSRLTWVIVIVSFVTVGILFAMTYSDYFSRHLKHL